MPPVVLPEGTVEILGLDVAYSVKPIEKPAGLPDKHGQDDVTWFYFFDIEKVNDKTPASDKFTIKISGGGRKYVVAKRKKDSDPWTILEIDKERGNLFTIGDPAVGIIK